MQAEERKLLIVLQMWLKLKSNFMVGDPAEKQKYCQILMKHFREHKTTTLTFVFYRLVVYYNKFQIKKKKCVLQAYVVHHALTPCTP